MLEGAEEAGPFAMVGHSAGGLHVRNFARQFPADVAGMVLVDSAHENQASRLDMLAPLDEMQVDQLGTCRLLSPLGLMRVLGVQDDTVRNDLPISEESRAAWLSRLHRTSFCETVLHEYEAIQIDTGQAEPPASLGDIPLIVLSRGEAPLPSGRSPGSTDSPRTRSTRQPGSEARCSRNSLRCRPTASIGSCRTPATTSTGTNRRPSSRPSSRPSARHAGRAWNGAPVSSPDRRGRPPPDAMLDRSLDAGSFAARAPVSANPGCRWVCGGGDEIQADVACRRPAWFIDRIR